jgi:uncharacterized repeat protein (TIGR02543 family)
MNFSFSILLSILIPQVLNIQPTPLPISLPENNVILRYAEADLGSDSVNLNDFNLQGRFNNGNTFDINKDANKGLVMTNTISQAASIFLKEQLAADTTSPGFSTYYVMNVYRIGTSPADGYVFVIAANSNSLGSSGGGLGYSGILNSVGIEFDFYNNENIENIASSDVFIDGSIRYTPGTIFDSGYISRWNSVGQRALVRSFHTWIEYNHLETKLELRVVPTDDENPNVNRPARPALPLLSKTINLSQLSNYFYGGFTAATGNSAQEMTLKSWYFSNAYIPGGINPDTQTIVVDSVPPTSPTLSTTNIDQSYQLEIAGGEDNEGGSGIAGYQYKINQGNWSAYNNSIPMTTIGEYFGRTIDRAGNYSSPSSIHLYEIRFWIGDRLVRSVQRVSTDTTYVVNDSIEEELYIYQTWFDNPSLDGDTVVSIQPRSSSINLYGLPTPKIYHIAYQVNGGQLPIDSPTTFTIGQSLTLVNPTKPGYTFEGWYLDEQHQTQVNVTNLPINDITLHAKWNLITYTITYEYHGGEVTNNPLTYSIESSTIQLTNPVRPGYAFGGWFTNESFTGNPVEQIQAGSIHDITLHAKWIGLTTTIYFITQETIHPITVQSGQPIGSLPTVTMAEGFTFLGWSLTMNDPSDLIDNDFIVDNSLTMQLYPIWSTSSPTAPISLFIKETIVPLNATFEIFVFAATLMIGLGLTTLTIMKRNHHGSL